METATEAMDFQPETADPRLMRDALGRFATGVTVITCQTEAGPVGITANSFASVSLDPALVLWSVARTSSRYAAFAGATGFAIHILGADERDLAARFAKSGGGFDGLAVSAGASGAPLIGGTLARFDCTLHAALDGGDHLILLGRVLAASFRDGAPLVFARGHYGGFAA